jgi:hypothetical protein
VGDGLAAVGGVVTVWSAEATPWFVAWVVEISLPSVYRVCGLVVGDRSGGSEGYRG